MRIYLLVATLLVGVMSAGHSDAQDGLCATSEDLAALQAGHWCEVPNSHLRQVEKKPRDFDDWNGSVSEKFNSFQRVSGLKGVMAAWNSAAYDSKRNCLMLTGGGHNDYGGNEVYKFCLNSLQWSRVTDPTPFPNRNPEFQNEDGSPVARHTFGGLAYLPRQDRFFVFDGAPDDGPGTCGMAGTWTLNLSARDTLGSYSPSQWELKTTTNEPDHSCGTASAYDPITDRVIVKSGFGTHTYDFQSNLWSKLSDIGRRNDWISLAIDSQRRILVEVGKGITALWSIDDGYSGGVVATSGSVNIQSATNPGLVYDAKSGKIVGWSGGAVVYLLDIDSRTWSAIAPAATNAFVPGPVTTAGGAFGRFSYSLAFDVYMYVDSVDGNVFFYRLGEGEPLVIPRPPADLTP